jgi:lysophospholipase L1-like esterase
LQGGELKGACTGPVCNFDTLAPWFARLAGSADAKGKPPVHILQIGDSHTAGDVLTGEWRELLQTAVGGGGRGVLAGGRPYDGYFTRGVTASMSPGWQIAATFGKGSAVPNPGLGFSGFSLTSTVPGARIGLSADGPVMWFDRFVLCAFAGLRANGVTVRTAETDRKIDLTTDVAEPRCTTLRFATPQSSVEVIADAGPVTVTSWGTFLNDGGVVLSNVGIVGSQLRHFGRTDDAVLAEELRAYTPDLIVLAFGTNEGFSDKRIDADAYEAVLRAQIGRLRALSPDTPILLLGAPDALSRNVALKGPGAVECGDGLFAPAGLAQVRGVQRKVATALHVAFWDWQARMGGACSARRWVAAGRMRGDFVHFRQPGGAVLARALQDDLARFAGSENKPLPFRGGVGVGQSDNRKPSPE